MRSRLAVLAFAAGCSSGLAFAKEPPPKPLPKPAAPAPEAAQVVARRSASLTSAIRAAYDKATDLGPASAVLIVIDTTPAVAEARAALVEAVEALSTAPKRPGAWQVAALGGAFATAVADPGALGPAIGAALAQKTHRALDTVGLLQKTIRTAPAKPGLVIYLAHAHAEDDCNLEPFIADLRASKRMLCVIGPEAAFERGWADVFSEDLDFGKDGEIVQSAPGVGRSPFAASDPKAPWRGGDTAYPMLPYRFGTSAEWSTVFPPEGSLGAEFEAWKAARAVWPPDPKVDPIAFDRWARRWVTPPDREKEPAEHAGWLARVGTPPDHAKNADAYAVWFAALCDSAPAVPKDGAEPAAPPVALIDGLRTWNKIPFPSSFGPYGLMRAAGATGGSYVLWGWGRSSVPPQKYDYLRCNRFAPDLRSRGEILSDAPRRPLSSALIAAWASLAGGPEDVLDRTPPIRAGGAAPMERGFGLLFSPIFHTPADRDRQVENARAAAALLDKARSALVAAIEKAGEPKDGVDQRLRADADLFVHALETVRFHVGEFAGCAAGMPASAWKLKKGNSPSIRREDWIPAAPDDAPVVAPPGAVHDAALGAALVASRRAFLERYKGTVFGAIVARNPVSTIRADVWEAPRPSGGGVPSGGSGPGSSRGGGSSTPPPTGGSTGNPGPTTGR